MKKIKKPEDKVFDLTFSQEELRNPNIRSTIATLLTIKFNMYRTNPYYEVSEAELVAIASMPLFTDIKKYGKGRFPNEIGKYRGKPVVLKK